MLNRRTKAFSALLAVLLTGCGAGLGVSQTQNYQTEHELTSKLAGDCPNFAQMANGDLLTVVSRDFGRGAKAGALVELLYPQIATDNLWDSYVGIRLDGKLSWAHSLTLKHQSLVPNSGIAESLFEGQGYRLLLRDFVRPTHNVHLRQVTFTNTSSTPLSPSCVFYGFFTLNHLPGGDHLRYDSAQKALIQTDDRVAIAVASDKQPMKWHCGDANLPLSSKQDARQAAEKDRLSCNTEAGPLPTGVNGALEQNLAPIPPGKSAQVTYAIGVGANEASALSEAREALQKGAESLVQEETQAWSNWLLKAKIPSMPEKQQAVYKRALITLKQCVAKSGAIIAAPTNLNPPYRLVWPRDGSIIATTLLDAGYPEEAKSFIAFLERVQLESGGWAINYFPDASRALWNFGTKGNEHDQVGTYLWNAEQVFNKTHENGWLSARWTSIQKAANFLLDVQEPSGLLSTCRDLWELDSDGTWTYSNGAGYAGLMAAARMAKTLGHETEATRYEAAGKRLLAAINSRLVTNGYFARGLHKGKLDSTLEVANLGLGAACFGVIPDSDPKMKATGEAIARSLTSSGGGIRRYEGDRYYDGQPWPVTTGWLALHHLALGETGKATKLMEVMTRYAYETEALMLGEQFNEEQKRWVSAFPLAWSEATYVRLAQALYR